MPPLLEHSVCPANQVRVLGNLKATIGKWDKAIAALERQENQAVGCCSVL